MKELKKHLKEKIFKDIYLFYGEEDFLKDYYYKAFKKEIITSNELLNFDAFEGNKIDIDKLMQAIETLPFMSEKKLVLVKNSEFFKAGNKDKAEKLVEFFEKYNYDTVVIFVEQKVDKRNKFYKTVVSKGYSVELKQQKENDLIEWVYKIIKKEKREIDKKDAMHIIRVVGTDMRLLKSNIEKVVDYKDEGERITVEDIENVCTKSTESKVFDLVKHMSYKNSKDALKVYESLLYYNESPFMVLSLIARQFKLLMQVKYYKSTGMMQKDIAKKLKLLDFIVRELLTQCNNFTFETLKQSLKDCLEVDYNIKNGKIKDYMAVEILILKYSSK